MQATCRPDFATAKYEIDLRLTEEISLFLCVCALCLSSCMEVSTVMGKKVDQQLTNECP